MLVEDLAVVMRIELTDESVLHHPLLKLDVTLSKHIFQDVLKGTVLILETLIIKSIVSSADDALEEARIVDTVSYLQGVLDGSADDVVHGLQNSEGLISRFGKLHQLHEMKPLLQHDQLVLLLLIELGLQRGIELEAVSQIQVIDRKDGEAGVELLIILNSV